MQGKALVISSYVPCDLRCYAWKNNTLVGKNDWGMHRACLSAEMFNSFELSLVRQVQGPRQLVNYFPILRSQLLRTSQNTEKELYDG
jgi:hypothetical protein